PQLLESGFHIAVIVRVVKGDERVFSRLGQSITHKGVRLHLNAYLLPANRRIGPGWTETAEYTEGSAVAKAKLAFIGPTADLRQAIDDAWAQLRAEEGQ
ncbi:MAG: hypothetical protein M3Q69_12350, partial [Acidobacteriota bacterium]|nr:hypothetical protein [Acidobacteriota bacterium]